MKPKTKESKNLTNERKIQYTIKFGVSGVSGDSERNADDFQKSNATHPKLILMTSKKKTRLLLIRHGDRLDYLKPTWRDEAQRNGNMVRFFFFGRSFRKKYLFVPPKEKIYSHEISFQINAN